MSAASATVSVDFETGISDICPHGRFNLAVATALRATAGKAASEYPYAILIDLNDISTIDDLALHVLPTLANRLHQDLIRCAVYVHDGLVARTVRRVVGRRIQLAASRDEAVSMVDRSAWRQSRMHAPLPPAAQSPAEARTLAAYACASWGLGHLTSRAEIIATELVSNAVVHACTEADITLVVTGDYLIIQVRDRSNVLPPTTRPSRADLAQLGGRGLYLVDSIASGWGAVTTPTGKTVWASLRTGPISL